MSMRPRDLPFLFMGHFCVAWSFFESQVDICTIIIHENYGGKDVKKSHPAQQISKKLNYLEDVAGKAPQLKKYKKTLTDIAKRARLRLPFRHNIIHGYAGFKDSPKIITFTRYESVFPLEEIKVEYSALEIFSEVDTIKNLGDELIVLVEELMRKRP